MRCLPIECVCAGIRGPICHYSCEFSVKSGWEQTIDNALTSRPLFSAGTVGRRRHLCLFGRGDVHGERATVQCRLRRPGSLATDGASSEGQTREAIKAKRRSTCGRARCAGVVVPVSVTRAVVPRTGTRLTTPIHLEMVRSRSAIQAMAPVSLGVPFLCSP